MRGAPTPRGRIVAPVVGDQVDRGFEGAGENGCTIFRGRCRHIVAPGFRIRPAIDQAQEQRRIPPPEIVEFVAELVGEHGTVRFLHEGMKDERSGLVPIDMAVPVGKDF